MPLSFLTPRVERLNAEGATEVVHEGGLLGRLRKPVLLLARELCVFSLFETANLPRSRRRQAAKLHARLASPYVIGGVTLTRCGEDFGVWWWDLGRIAPLVEARYGKALMALRPETLAQPHGTGWRIVKLAHGYEAQCWRAKGLIASVWRRDRFDIGAWTTFTRLQRGGETPPDTPPPAQTLPIADDSEAFSLAHAEISREHAALAAAAGVGFVTLSATALLLGQGLHLSAESTTIEAEIAEVRRTTPQVAATRTLELDRQKLTAYREIEEGTNPISAAGAAIGIVAIHDLTPSELDAETDTLRLTLPYTAVEKAGELVSEFEQSGYFYDVRPRTDAANQTLIFEMKTRQAAPPLSAAG